MASWKKVIVSGSVAQLLAVTASAGFTGSFFGDGSGLSGVSGVFPTTPLGGAALETTKFFVNDGASKFVSGSQVAAYVYSGVSGDVTITSGGTAAIGSGVIVNNDVNASAAIAYTKLNFAGSSFVSASVLSSPLQGQALLTINGVAGSTIDLGLETGDSPTFAGVTADAVRIGITGTNEIDTTSGNLTIDSAGGLVTIDDNLSVTGNATITGDLVVSGTASFQNTQNLLVADRFALFASGSVATGDGGIVIQQATQNVGELFGYDSGAGRWAYTSSFNANTSTFTPAAYAGVVEFTAGSPSSDPLYGGSSNGYGTIFVNTSNGDIFIYS